jgi:PAS domain S-box-containing protein
MTASWKNGSVLFNDLKQAVIVTDLAGRITSWNEAAEELYGWKAEEVLGKSIVDVTPAPAMAEYANEIMDSLRGGKSWGGHFMVRHRDGHEFEAMVIDAPLMSNGELAGVIGVSIPAMVAPRDTPTESLTPREQTIARMTAAGKTSAQIAVELGLSHRTVESHRLNLYRKLGINSRTELIVFAIRNGYLQMESM